MVIDANTAIVINMQIIRHFLYHCRWGGVLFRLAAVLLFSATPLIAHTQYFDDLYRVQYYKLDNGLQIVLKKRPGAKNVSIRLVVDVGTLDFPCEKKQLPHFLEHMLFLGTSTMSETELREYLRQNGGTSNATTSDLTTTYNVDIYSPHIKVGLDYLYSIITKSTLKTTTVTRTRHIIHRELGGKPSAIRQWLYARGIGQRGIIKGLLQKQPYSNISCPILSHANGISRKDILNVYKTFYVPNNMTLIIVGNMNPDYVQKLIKQTFGRMVPKKIKKPTFKRRRPSDSYLDLTGTFAPVISSDFSIDLVFFTEGESSKDKWALQIIASYLFQRMFDELRTKHSLSYNPYVYRLGNILYGAIILGADLETKDMDRALDIMWQELESLKQGKINRKILKKVKRKILLSYAQGPESNSAFSKYYVKQHYQFKKYGRLVNRERNLQAVTPTDIKRVANKYFNRNNAFVSRNTPTLTHTQLFVIIGILLLLMCAIAIKVTLYIRKHKKTSFSK